MNPALDLELHRDIDVAAETLWACWTQPGLIERWFCPVPWRATDVEVDLRPGGRFNSVIRGPEGEEMPGRGCYLEVVQHRRLVWTDALTEGFRPAASSFMTGIISFAPITGGTRYHALVLHADEAARERHLAMGFEDGWGAATDQLVALARTLTP